MAKETATPELTSEDIAVLLKALRGQVPIFYAQRPSGRPMTTQQLVEALKAAASR